VPVLLPSSPAFFLYPLPASHTLMPHTCLVPCMPTAHLPAGPHAAGWRGFGLGCSVPSPCSGM